MVLEGAVEGKAKECVLCGTVVAGGAEGMEAHTATACLDRPGRPPMSLGMDGR
jgi:hypothetical protein